ncbi:MAG: response regulator [Chloroflexi bacterium]|nr:response regulator [Chloroflexota bacterium]
MIHQIRIFLTDDHAILRPGLRALLNAEPDMQVVGEAGDGLECVRCVAEIQPDLILLEGGRQSFARLARARKGSRMKGNRS